MSSIGANLGKDVRFKLYDSVLRKSASWHDDKDNAPAIIGNLLNTEVSSLTTTAIDVTTYKLEGFGGLLIGLGLALYYSWPIVVCCMVIAPLMYLGNKVGHRVKMK